MALNSIYKDPTLSLTEKWKHLYQVRKRDPCPPRRIDRIVPVWFLITLATLWAIGTLDGLPRFYEDGWILFCNQFFASFISLELLMNWLCIRYVKSPYIPEIHGTGPTELAAQQHEPPINELTDENKNGSNANELLSSENDSFQTDTTCANVSQHNVTVNAQPHTIVFMDTSSRAMDASTGNVDMCTQRKSASSFTVYVATSLPDKNGIPQRKAYSYWSWKPCMLCKRLRPPRCHHCVLCKTCVLKRDHHCFFAGACIGFNNQRHFLVFLLWAFIGSLYAAIHCIPYYRYAIYPISSVVDIIPGVVHLRWVFGYAPFFVMVVLSLSWTLVMFIFWSGLFLRESVIIMCEGQTTFERDNKVSIRDSRSLQGRIRAVFGSYWPLNFIFPLHALFVPDDHPGHWPYIKT